MISEKTAEVFRLRTKPAFLYAALSLLGLLWGNLDVISSQNPEIALVAKENFTYQLEQLSQLPAFNTLVLVLFWGGIALIVNVFIWALINIAIEARNELVMEVEYVNKGSFFNQVKAPLVQAGLGLILLASLVGSALYVIPFLLTWFRHYLLLSPQIGAYAMLVVVWLALAAVVYFLVSLGKLVFLAA